MSSWFMGDIQREQILMGIDSFFVCKLDFFVSVAEHTSDFVA